jgi:uncharacterized membrane protein YsdA (DUF1294 family)
MLQLVWAGWGLWNVVTLLLFGFDKWRSRGEKRRVPERTLLWCVFWGGWLGAWLAMAWFRHKTVKQPFRSLALLWTVVNPTWVLVWWTLRGNGA